MKKPEWYQRDGNKNVKREMSIDICTKETLEIKQLKWDWSLKKKVENGWV